MGCTAFVAETLSPKNVRPWVFGWIRALGFGWLRALAEFYISTAVDREGLGLFGL